MSEQLYFAYGSNMNLDQMDFRCPKAAVVGNVRLEDYRLTFCSRNSGSGVATILPEKGSYVDGVLWKITEDCERHLDFYEGYPNLYGKETITVTDQENKKIQVMAYVMNAPYKDCPSKPSNFYLKGILEGCRQNGLQEQPIRAAVRRTQKEIKTPPKMSYKGRTR